MPIRFVFWCRKVSPEGGILRQPNVLLNGKILQRINFLSSAKTVSKISSFSQQKTQHSAVLQNSARVKLVLIEFRYAILQERKRTWEFLVKFRSLLPKIEWNSRPRALKAEHTNQQCHPCSF